MQGVEILTSAQVATEFAFNWPIFWVTFGIMCIGCLIIGFRYSLIDYDWYLLFIASFFGLVAGGIIGVLFATMCEIPTTHETQYKVTISEEVSMTEFYEYYEVIDQDGKIFTVREKNK